MRFQFKTCIPDGDEVTTPHEGIMEFGDFWGFYVLQDDGTYKHAFDIDDYDTAHWVAGKLSLGESIDGFESRPYKPYK